MRKEFLLLLAGVALLVWGAHSSVAAQSGMTQEGYAQVCGTCHPAYGAGLLPLGSWQKIINGSKDHFGESLALDTAQKTALMQYFTQNSAEVAPYKVSRKIMSSLNGATPMRITEVPYIIHKHRKIPATTFQLPKVAGFANCAACHPGAVRFDFDDDNVNIPQ